MRDKSYILLREQWAEISDLDDVQLANYVAGIDPGPVEAGRISRDIAEYLGVPEGSVILLSDYNLTKTKFRHKEIDFQDYIKLPDILAEGFVIPGNRNRSVEICHLDVSTSDYRFWALCLKVTREEEVFMTMFHRFNLKEARRLYRRAQRRDELIRDHQNELARRILRRTRSA